MSLLEVTGTEYPSELYFEPTEPAPPLSMPFVPGFGLEVSSHTPGTWRAKLPERARRLLEQQRGAVCRGCGTTVCLGTNEDELIACKGCYAAGGFGFAWWGPM